ncbi:peroxidase-like protein isoform X2 [Octopus sinensis]|uniref:Peroxidase-like protein isoform X2 n=1 Tax=Octopus sinensis TaxID=2607531 RepID=A0A6P7U3H2_9MOLL|nr:peroxidase-like protein isoform X2 [Octopus sinensis]
MATNWLCLICWTAVSLTVTLNIVCLAQWNSVFARSSLSAAGARSRAGVSRPASDREKNNLRQRITQNDVRVADQRAREVLARKNQEDRFFFNLGVDRVRKNTAIFMHNIFISKAPKVTDGLRNSGVLSITATKELSKRLGLTKKELSILPELSDVPQPEFRCPFRTPRCSPNSKFREADGSCNNLQKPLWGKAGMPLKRFLSPWYDDGVSSPRTLGVFGNPLPSARLVSTTIHEADSENTRNPFVSHMVMQWGQFIDHDITNTPVDTGFQHADISCCIDDIPDDVRKRLEVDLRNRESCFPIPIPSNDRHFKKTCLNFVRSMQSPNSKCNFGFREQVNQISAYIDGGAVYASTKEDQNELRTRSQGLLKESGAHLLPKDSQQSCVLTSSDNYCFRAGDRRVNEQMGLASLHTIFLREHNRIARQFNSMGLGWKDERVFQETKRIISAMIQHINYREFLPAILNRQFINFLNLNGPRRGFHDIYDSTVDATIRNGFSTAAFRFGHSMVRSFFSKLSSGFNSAFGSPTLLKTMYGKTEGILQNQPESVDAFVRGLVSDSAQNADRFMSKQLTDHLFEDTFGNSLDLASFNIQRGRDHGIPPYNVWRQWCDFSTATNFGTGPGGLIDHSFDSANKLKSIYSHPDDIDLFSGGLSENPIRGGIVGPTFACIIGRQFHLIKVGDRFWYERNDPTVGFTLNQLDQIRQTSLSAIICTNTNISRIQPNSFLLSNGNNRLVSCDSLPKFDLSAWGQCEPGRWGNWSPWSACVRGRQRSQRQCNSAPPPKGCGCEGSNTRFQRCSGRRCRRLVRFNNRSFWVWGRC